MELDGDPSTLLLGHGLHRAPESENFHSTALNSKAEVTIWIKISPEELKRAPETALPSACCSLAQIGAIADQKEPGTMTLTKYWPGTTARGTSDSSVPANGHPGMITNSEFSTSKKL